MTDGEIRGLFIKDACELCGKVETLMEEDVVACPDLVACYVRDFEQEGLLDQDDALAFHVHLAHPFYICRKCRTVMGTSP